MIGKKDASFVFFLVTVWRGFSIRRPTIFSLRLDHRLRLDVRCERAAVLVDAESSLEHVYFPNSGIQKLASYSVQTTRDLEDREIRETGVYRLTS